MRFHEAGTHAIFYYPKTERVNPYAGAVLQVFPLLSSGNKCQDIFRADAADQALQGKAFPGSAQLGVCQKFFSPVRGGTLPN